MIYRFSHTDLKKKKTKKKQLVIPEYSKRWE